MRNRERHDWFRLVEEWLKSGTSAKAWCRANQLVYTTFVGWCKRYKKIPKSTAPSSEASLSNPKFIELKSKNEVYDFSGILVECEGVLIHLCNGFNPSTFQKCLNALRG